MIIYAAIPAYDNNNCLYHQVLPYNIKGTIYCHFKFYSGLFSLIPFLTKCRLSRKSAYKLAHKLTERYKYEQN